MLDSIPADDTEREWEADTYPTSHAHAPKIAGSLTLKEKDRMRGKEPRVEVDFGVFCGLIWPKMVAKARNKAAVKTLSPGAVFQAHFPSATTRTTDGDDGSYVFNHRTLFAARGLLTRLPVCPAGNTIVHQRVCESSRHSERIPVQRGVPAPRRENGPPFQRRQRKNTGELAARLDCPRVPACESARTPQYHLRSV